MKKFYTFTILGLVAAAIVLQAINIYIVNTEETDGISAGELMQELLSLEEENIEIESELLSYASYRNVASKAAEMGLSDTREFVSLYDPVEVASLR